MSLRNNPKPNSFFIADLKICQVLWGFEQLCSTIMGGVIPAQRHTQSGFRL